MCAGAGIERIVSAAVCGPDRNRLAAGPQIVKVHIVTPVFARNHHHADARRNHEYGAQPAAPNGRAVQQRICNGARGGRGEIVAESLREAASGV